MSTPSSLAIPLLLVATAIVLIVRRRRFERLWPQRAPCQARRVQARLLTDSGGSEAIVIEGRLGNVPMPFLVDTAYAGAPVISLSYLALREREASVRWRSGTSNRDTWRETTRLLSGQTFTETELNAALERLLHARWCRAFTAGCSMRLVGIGQARTSHADMLLCPSIAFGGEERGCGVDADVLVTHALQHNVNILTIDYLLHRAPALIEPRRESLTFHATVPRGFHRFDADLVGGAFRIPVTINGLQLIMFVDTGAAASVSLGRAAALRVTGGRCEDGPRRVTQVGVHSEEVCSDVVRTTVTLAGTEMQVDTLLNAQEVEDADGYLGLGYLRCFDMLFTYDALSLRSNGLSPSATVGAGGGRCTNGVLQSCGAANGSSL